MRWLISSDVECDEFFEQTTFNKSELSNIFEVTQLDQPNKYIINKIYKNEGTSRNGCHQGDIIEICGGMVSFENCSTKNCIEVHLTHICDKSNVTIISDSTLLNKLDDMYIDVMDIVTNLPSHDKNKLEQIIDKNFESIVNIVLTLQKLS